MLNLKLIKIMRARDILKTDPKKYPDYNRFFHYEICFTSGNIKLLNTLASLYGWLPNELKMTKTEDFQKSYAEHEDILWNLVRRDVQGAEDAMRKHILRNMNDILTKYNNSQENY